MLNERLANLLSLLSQDDYQTSQYLAQRLNLSSKTVRNLIKQLNNDLLGNGANIITKHGYGFKLQVYNLEEFNRFLTAEHSNIPNSPEERIQYLLEYFLNNEKYVKEEDISDLLHVCKKTLTADLKKVEQILNRYGLSVKRKPYYGMKVVGDEFHIRLCIAECIENKKIRNLLIVDNDVKREISLIADCITECLDNETYMISDIALQNLIIHIYISVKRIQEGHYVPLLYAEDDNYIGGEEYKLAKKCTNKIEENFHIQFPEQEVAYIAIHLAGKKIAKARKDGNGNTVISSGISELVTAMLEEVYQVFHIDFRNDLELIMSLGQHLVPLIVRIKYGMRMKNPLLDEIKKNYCLAYVMASQASVVIKQRLYKELDDDEIGYIALAFALALERHRTQIKGKNILLVCYSGIGSSKLLAFRLKEIFGNYINEIYTCSLNTIGKVNYSKFDYIFTTVPINEPVPLPVCEISFPIQTQKFDTMIQFLKPKEECKITQYYPEDLFFSGVDLHSKEEVIAYMCEEIAKRRTVPKGFYKAVMKREKLAKTSFGNRVAMPHPYKSLTKDSFVCVCILKKDILWDDNQKVRVVFLVSIQKKVSKNIKEFYKITSKLLLSDSCINELIKNSNYECLTEILRNLESQSEEELDGRY